MNGRSPEMYDELGVLTSKRSATVLDKNNDEGIVEVSYNWTESNYKLVLNEKYGDQSHLDALDHLVSEKDDEDLPRDLRGDDLRSVSAALSSGMELEWTDGIELGHPASDVHY